MKRTVRLFLMVIAWIVIIAGAFLFIDGFLPSRSQGPTPSWVEVALGTGGLLGGLFLRWLSIRMGATRKPQT